MFVYLDIETIPSQRNEAKARAAARVSPPGNISKAETLVKWEAEKRPALEYAEWEKTALDGGWGELACICWAIGDGPVQEATRPTIADSEADVLSAFFSSIQSAQESHNGRLPHFVGHNLAGFDLRFLWQRAVVLEVPPPFKMRQDATAWSGVLTDTMHLWAGTRGFVKLPELCEALRVDVGHEDTIDGSKVWECYKAGDFATVLAHCRADVERVRAVHRRMTFEGVE